MKEEIQKNSKKTKEKQKQIPLLQQSHYQIVSNIMINRNKDGSCLWLCNSPLLGLTWDLLPSDNAHAECT